MNDTARKILFKDGPDAAVHRAWDIGHSDTVTVTWFCGDKILCEQSFTGRTLYEVAAVVKNRGFKNVGNDYVRASDAHQEQLQSGRTLKEHMRAFGLNPVALERTPSVKRNAALEAVLATHDRLTGYVDIGLDAC